MIANGRLESAALAILFIKVHEDSFYLKGQMEEINGTLLDILKKLPESEADNIRSLAASITLDEIAGRIRIETFDP
mgnify:CR=1 FL=1